MYHQRQKGKTEWADDITEKLSKLGDHFKRLGYWHVNEICENSSSDTHLHIDMTVTPDNGLKVGNGQDFLIIQD